MVLVVALAAMDTALAQRSVETHTDLSKDPTGCRVSGVCRRPHHRHVAPRERATDDFLRNLGCQALTPPCLSDPIPERCSARIVQAWTVLLSGAVAAAALG